MIFESTTEGVLIVDLNWRIDYVNGPGSAQLAEDRDVIGMTLSEAFPHDTEILSPFREAMSEQRPASFEAFCERRSIWYALNAFPSSQGMAIYVRDITEHKHSLEARRLMQAQLHQSQKMESVGQLTGGVAHDFNNLLTVVSGNFELIEDAADNGRVPELAAAGLRAAGRGEKLTAQPLAFSTPQRLDPRLANRNHPDSRLQSH